MGAKGYFIVVAALVALMTAGSLTVAAVLMPEPNAWVYVLLQLCLVLTVVLFIILYRKTVTPIKTLSGGISLVKEQDFSTRLRPVGQADADQIIDLFNRMIDRLHNEELRIREQDYFLELLIAASPMGVLIADVDFRISSGNPALCRFLGIASVDAYRGKNLEDSGLPLLVQISGMEPGSSRIVQTDPLHIYKCTLSSFMDKGFSHPFYMIEPLAEELFEAEKNAYRKVIRVISHEVNNTMAGIVSALGIMEKSSAESGDEDTAGMLSILLSRIDRMSRFITEYASMARLPEPVCRNTDANAFIRRVFPFLENLKGSRDIRFVLDLDEAAGEVDIDQVLMEQALTNIVKNAVEAFSSGSPENSIAIVTRPGYWCISNNGDPISESAAGKLFTPFFSTKPEGKGIGLLMIHEILTRSGIRFNLSTGEDGITRFEMFFRQV